MKLNIKEWKPFVTSRLFSVLENGKANQQMLDDGNNCFYVGAKKDDNGVMSHCERNEALITKKNCIVFICDGQWSVGFANYMDEDFLGTPNIVAGYNKHLNRFTGIFLATVYSQERPKYSFGRKWKNYLRDTVIKLPIQHNADGTILLDTTREYSDEGYLPDWHFMENYIKSLHCNPITTKNKPCIQLSNVKTWKEFLFGDLISSIYKAKAINKDDLSLAANSSYAIRYITRTGDNNGCELLADINGISSDKIEKGNAISIGDTTATCFYQDEDFITGDHMVIVRADKWLNRYTAFFILSLLNKECYRYSYGRAFLIERIKKTIIKLPVCDDNKPDWEFMENYIKALPFGDRLNG